VSGLVAVTPASGFVSPTSGIIFGVVSPIMCNLALAMKGFLPIDDAFDVFCVHGVGGIIGNLLTGVFAEKSIAALDGTTRIRGGGLYDGNWSQVGVQAIDSLAGMGWSFFVSLFLLCIINSIRGLEIRAKAQDEKLGLDKAELGLSMYQYVEEIRLELESLKEKVESLQSSKNGSINNISVSTSLASLTPVEELDDGKIISNEKNV
jgi:Amt family ammonium transporter